MRHRLLAGMLALGFALSAHAQGNAKLAVGPDAGGYACPDGKHIYVPRCYDGSAQASCQVVQLEPRSNGYQCERSATRADLLVRLKDCKLWPIVFDPNGVSLVIPKAAPSAPAAATFNFPIPGPKTPTALVKMTDSGASTFYLDDLSVRAPGSKGLIEIWALQVFQDAVPDRPGVRASWERYLVDLQSLDLPERGLGGRGCNRATARHQRE